MKTIDISGMGGSYEAGCQKMLLNGLKWLKEHPTFDFAHAYKGYSGVYGVMTAENKPAEELDKAVIGGLDATGAMHQAVISHLAYICKHGHDQWIAEAEGKGRKVYEIDEVALDQEIETADREWKAKLASGYNPLTELINKSKGGSDNLIVVDAKNPKSIERAAKQIAAKLKGITKS